MSRLTPAQRAVGFQPPVALTAAFQLVRRQHPYRMDGEVFLEAPPIQAEAQRLLRSLLTLDEATCIERLSAFSVRKVRLVYYAAQTHGDPATLHVVRLIFRVRQDSFLRRAAFERYLTSNGDTDFQPLARAFAETTEGAPALWKSAVDSDQPLAVLAAEYAKQPRGLREWTSQPAVALSGKPELMSAMEAYWITMAPMARSMERREGLETLMEWFTLRIPEPEKDEWLARYLAGMGNEPTSPTRGEWHGWPLDHAVLTRIVARHGEVHAEAPFWSRISTELRQRFSWWYQDCLMTQSLAEGERTRFWRFYLDEILSTDESAGHEVVFIRFAQFTAVIFKQVGTATYLLASKDAAGLRYKNTNDIRRFVQQDVKHLGRYTHMGHFETWQRNASEVVANVKALVARRAMEGNG